MASSLSGLSALGIWPFDSDQSAPTKQCAPGQELDTWGNCTDSTGGVASMVCGPDEFLNTKTLSCDKSASAPSGCPSGQFPNGPGGACTTNFCQEGYEPAPGGGCQPVKKSSGTPAKTGGGGFVKPTVPSTPIQNSQSEIPWGTIALAAVAVGGFLVWRKKRMTSNGYDEDC